MVERSMSNVGSMQLVGAAEVKKLLDAYPKLVARAAVRKGLKAGALHLLDALKGAAPVKTGTLQSAMRIANGRPRNKANFRVKVGLGPIKGDVGAKAMARYEKDIAAGRKRRKPKSRTRFYYKTLELPSKRGAPLHPFFMRAYNGVRNEIGQLIVNGTRDAVYEEAARINRRTLGLKKTRGR